MYNQISKNVQPSDTPVPLDRTTLVNLNDFVPCYPLSPDFTTRSGAIIQTAPPLYLWIRFRPGNLVYSYLFAVNLKSTLEGGRKKDVDIVRGLMWIHGACPRLFHWPGISVSDTCKKCLVQCQVARTCDFILQWCAATQKQQTEPSSVFSSSVSW